MAEVVEDFLSMEDLAEILGRPPAELKQMKVRADAATMQALKQGSARIIRTEPKVVSPKQLRADFHTVAHHHRPPQSSPALPGDGLRPVQSRYQQVHQKLKRKALAPRPPGAPSILEELGGPVKLIIKQHQSPGDILMLTAAIRDLHKSHPGQFVTDLRTTCTDLWEHNPYCTTLDEKDPAAHFIYAEYPLINQSNTHPFHFIHGFTKHLEALLGVRIKPGEFKGDIHVADMEKRWYSQVYEKLQRQVPFWIIDAGHKMDYTAKHWDSTKYQAVVDALPEITFVQVGAKGNNHNHPELTGDNVLNLVGQTTLRQMIRLMYNAAGVITPVSFPMHLAAAVEMHPWYKRKHRPCVVLAGGREPQVWEAYSNHQFLHTCGMLPCNSQGGCWKSRTVPVGDGDKKDTNGLCERPVKTEAGEIVPQCMDMISVEEVVSRIRGYLRHYDYSSEDPNDWGPKAYEGFPDEVQKLRDEALARVVNKAKKS